MYSNFLKQTLTILIILSIIVGCSNTPKSSQSTQNQQIQITLKEILENEVPNPYKCEYTYEDNNTLLEIKDKPMYEVYPTYNTEMKKANWTHKGQDGQRHYFEKSITGNTVKIAIEFIDISNSTELYFELIKKDK